MGWKDNAGGAGAAQPGMQPPGMQRPPGMATTGMQQPYGAPPGSTGIVPPGMGANFRPPVAGAPPTQGGAAGLFGGQGAMDQMQRAQGMYVPQRQGEGPGPVRPATGRGSGLGMAGAAAPHLQPGDNWQANQDRNVKAQMDGLMAQGAAGDWAPYASHSLMGDPSKWDPRAYGAIEAQLNDNVAGGMKFHNATNDPGTAYGGGTAGDWLGIDQSQAQLAKLKALQGTGGGPR